MIKLDVDVCLPYILSVALAQNLVLRIIEGIENHTCSFIILQIFVLTSKPSPKVPLSRINLTLHTPKISFLNTKFELHARNSNEVLRIAIYELVHPEA